MMKNSIAVILCLFFLAIIAALLIVGSRVDSNYKGKVLNMQTELEMKKESISTFEKNHRALEEKYTKLEGEYDSLVTQYDKLLTNHSSLSAELSNVSGTIEEVEEQFEDFEAEVRDRLTWFNENSNVKFFDVYDSIMQELAKECLNIDEGRCYIDLKCIERINQYHTLLYRYDKPRHGKDLFLDLNDIYTQKGGDCEDLARLFTAEYNFLVEQCQHEGYTFDSIVLRDSGGKSLAGGYMYMICGVFRPEELVVDVYGHCMVALVDEPIVTSLEVERVIEDAIVVEPQTATFEFYMNTTDKVKVFGNDDMPNTLFLISIVVTDQDMKLLKIWSETIEWMGYQDLLENAQEIEASIK